MKPLDSLALLLALSTFIANDTLAIDSMKEQIVSAPLVEAKSAADTLITDPSPTVTTTPRPLQQGKGTFRASQLYWSERDKEVGFRGDVRVDYEKQQFHGKGAFTFLGKVQLLFVDGQPVKPGKLLKLEPVDYELVVLNSKDATAKYGDKGLYGAVEISRKQ